MATGGSGCAVARSRTARRLSCSSSRRSSQRRWSSPESSGAARSASVIEPSRVARQGSSSRLAARLEALGGVLADRLEHREPRLAVGALVDADEALVGERHEPIDDVDARAPRPGRVTASAASRSEAARRRRTAGRAADGCRRRAGRSSRRWRRAASAAARAGRAHPAEQTSRWCSSRARIASGERSLIRAAASSMASGMPCRRAADRGHGRRVGVRDGEPWPDGDRAGDEQPDRLVLAERRRGRARASPPGRLQPLRLRQVAGVGRGGQPRHRVLLLAGDVERDPGGDEGREPRRSVAAGRR